MIQDDACCLAMVTTPDAQCARRLVGLALEARLAACANVTLNLESHYWWQGKIQSSSEALILFKTTSMNLARLETLILQNHPYETPEFVVIPILHGNLRYMEWIRSNSTP